LILACVAAEAAVLRVGIDDLDEGYFVQQAARVLHGQVPYHDFETLYSPGLVYLHAALFAAVGGPSLMVARAVSLACRAALALLLFALTRPLVRRPAWAAAPAVVLLVGLDDVPVRWEPHPGWPSTLFAILAVWCLAQRPRLAWLIAGGTATAAAFVFKQNTGVFILAAAVLWCGWFGRAHAYPLLGAFVIATLAWAVPLLIAVDGQVQELAVLVGDVNQAGLWSAPDPTLLLPVACLAGGVWLVRRERDPRLRWYLLAGSALFLTEFPRMDTSHLMWSAPMLLVLGAIALDRVRIWTALTALAAALFVLAPNWSSRAGALAELRVPIDGVQAPVATAADLQATVADIQQCTRPGEPIFVYPSSPLVYVLADRPNATRFDHLNPGAASPGQIHQVIADLSAVRLIVISDFWVSAWGASDANVDLETWISSHYTDVGRHGSYRVLAAGL
jgi:4-amino-4-deoxy-L-arabinose transferase-like glycosyltransferase